MLCNLILNGQTEVLKQIPWTPGKEFEIVTISFDPSESFDLARKKKAVYLSDYGRPASRAGISSPITKGTPSVWRIWWDSSTGLTSGSRSICSTPPGSMSALTPEAKVARYLYGVRYKPMDMRFALTEAAESRSTFSVERVLLFCYHYDPTVGSYVLFAL